jgi:hypothetical protein
MVVKWATAAGTGAPAVVSPEASAAALSRHVDDLVEPAKVAAYEDLDEGRTAIGIATSWLRGKMQAIG